MLKFFLYPLLVISIPSLIQGKTNTCEKKYFEVSINEDADFLEEILYGLLTNDRCGVARVQICPPSLSYTLSESDYFDSEYKQWTVSGDNSSSLKSSLDFKFRRSGTDIGGNIRNSTPISLPSDILALFDFFHAVSRYYDI